MKKKALLPISLLNVSILSFSLIGCGQQKKEEDKSTRQKREEVETYSNNYGNKRTYSEKFFLDPNNSYRVLPVNHGSALSPGGMSTSKLDEYMEQGFGGIVTNVALGTDYLKNDNNWELMEEVVSYGIEKYDMHMMIYDEEYYPSGAARTLTLDAEPQDDNWEAQGLVHSTVSLEAGVPVVLKSEHGHTLINAFVYPQGSLSSLNPNDAVDLLPQYKEGDTYVPDSSGLLVLLYHKNWYEGTHYQNNLMESRRYIDLLKAEPVQEFISNTYDTYYNHFGKYFGKNIDSFFFDEPSLPGMYFTPTSATVIDPIDGEIEQYPAVNFDDEICEKFAMVYGYDPTPYLPYLFEKTNTVPAIRRFRWQYYQLLSDQVSNNFTGQLAGWANNHGILSSGHFLAEEDISNHPLMLGNYMDNYHNMPMPGIDMTHGSALDAITIGANVAKQARSVADFDGKQKVFCEIGQDEGAGSSVYDNIANVAVLQSMGINYLVSYYKLASEEDSSLLANSLARINYLIDGNTSEKDVLVYYPIESIFCDETPYNSNGQRIYTGQWGFNEYVTKISSNYRQLLQNLVRNQIDYDIFTQYMIEDSQIKDGKLIAPNGQEYTTIVMPTLTALPETVLNKLNEAVEAGVKVILQDINEVLSLDENKQIEFDITLAEIKANENCIDLNNLSFNELYSTLVKENTKLVNFTSINTNIVARKQNNIDNTLYMLVNTSPKVQNITLICDEVGTEYNSWDVFTGSVNGMCVEVKEGKSFLTISLPGYGVGMYTIGGSK